MTTTTKLQGHTCVVDGSPLVFWTESGPDAFSVVARDRDGHEVGYARATHAAGSRTAHLTLRTSHAFRRRGLGRELLAGMLRWAEGAGVEFLVGSGAATDAAARGFLAKVDPPVAIRANGRTMKFAIQTPAPVPASDDRRDRIARALEAGASLPEAEALARHPGTMVPRAA